MRPQLRARQGRSLRRRPRGTPLPRLLPLAGAVVLTAMTGLLAGPAVAAPAAHTWGGLGFRAGLVCTSGGTTSPLASWDLGGGFSAAYLVQPVTAAGGQVSAVPPLSSQGPQSGTAVTSAGGPVGQLSPALVPALAALLARVGPSGNDTTVAALAHLVMSAVNGSNGLPGCSDGTEEARLRALAPTLAGPYSIDFAAHPGQSLPGRGDSTSVTVLSAGGTPVPGAKVTFDADTPVFNNGATTTVTTNSAGRATARFTVATGTNVAGVRITASASVATELTSVSVQASPSPSNPSGSSVAALVPGASSTSQATESIQLDRGAHPKLSLAADPSAALSGTAITPKLTVTGLNGHQAKATVTAIGPLPLTDRTLCSNRTAADFTGGARLGSVDSTVSIAGDGVVSAAALTPKSPGCYFATAKLTTTDATPVATATASLGRPVTVLDTVVSAHLTTPLVSRTGSSGLTLQVRRTHGVGISLRTTLTGPVTPDESADGCASADYSAANTVSDEPTLRSGAAPSAAGASSSPAPAGATLRNVSVRAPGAGCTRVRTQLILHTGSEDLSVQVPMTGRSDLLAIAPKVQVTTERRWGQTGEAVTVRASVSATYNQSGHLSVQLRRTATSELGCQGADFTGLTPGAAGKGVAVTTDYAAVDVPSVVLTRTGCYLPVVMLRMDANTAITATSATSAGSVIAIGVDPSPAADRPAGVAGPDGVSLKPIVIVLIVFGVAVLVAILATVRLARAAEPDADGSATLTLTQRPSPH